MKLSPSQLPERVPWQALNHLMAYGLVDCRVRDVASNPNLIQVVNALLTQLDKLKHRKNVLVMSTSNLAKAIGSHVPSNCGFSPGPLTSQ